MVAGKLVEIDEDYVPESESESDTSSIGTQTEEQKIDPMDVPADFKSLMEEVHNKGGFNIGNCQEIELIQYIIHESKLDEGLKKGCQDFFSVAVNMANLWVIHFNKHKDKY